MKCIYNKAYGMLALLLPFCLYGGAYDVTYVGFYKFADGIGRRSIGQIQMLKDTLKVNFIPSEPGFENDIEPSVLNILRGKDKTPGTIMVFVDSFYGHKESYFGRRSECKIKFAYVTVESTKAPVSWVKFLNSYFDGVLVPDPWCAQSLKISGVIPPIFILPEVCFLEDYLQEPLQVKSQYPFCFGVSAQAWPYKNYDLLLEAFAAEFRNSPDVTLKIHNHYKKRLILLLIK